MVRTNLCEYRDPYILVQEAISVPNTAAQGVAINNTNKQVILKNCASFYNCITEINNTQVEHIDIIMPMYNLIEYTDAYSKSSGNLWRYYRDETALFVNGNIIASFKFKQQITGKTGNGSTKAVEIMIPLKHPSNFWRTFEMSIINCEVCLQLIWSKKCYSSWQCSNQTRN